MRQMKMKMKYSDKMMYFCYLCQSAFTEPVQVHFNIMHQMHNPAENMKYVHVMSSSSSSSGGASVAKNPAGQCSSQIMTPKKLLGAVRTAPPKNGLQQQKSTTWKNGKPDKVATKFDLKGGDGKKLDYNNNGNEDLLAKLQNIVPKWVFFALKQCFLSICRVLYIYIGKFWLKLILCMDFDLIVNLQVSDFWLAYNRCWRYILLRNIWR